MKKYFKIVGYIELSVWLLSVIFFLIYVVRVVGAAFGDAYTNFVLIFALIVLLFLGPAVGFLFLWAGSTTDFTVGQVKRAIIVINEEAERKEAKAKEIKKEVVVKEEIAPVIKKPKEPINEGDVTLNEDIKSSPYDPTVIPKGTKGWLISEKEGITTVRFRVNGLMKIVDVESSKLSK